jgi:hypothetical protein
MRQKVGKWARGQKEGTGVDSKLKLKLKSTLANRQLWKIGRMKAMHRE